MVEGLKIGDRYNLGQKIGKGSFGSIYLAVQTQTGKEFAAKLEESDCKVSRLHHEVKLLKSLRGGVGIVNVYYSGVADKYNVMVMDLCGPSLEALFNACSRRFSLKSVLMIADHMLHRLEYIHSRGIIHRDMKPDNILRGHGNAPPLLYLIDFGCARRYIDPKTNKHIRYSAKRKLTGTVRYASIYAHEGIEQSRRDDLESLGHILMYLNLSKLPWQGGEGTREERDRQIMETKKAISPTDLCKGFPDEFATYISYCRALAFEETPDYEHLRGLFKSTFEKCRLKDDGVFDWAMFRRPRASGLTLPAVEAQHPTKKFMDQHSRFDQERLRSPCGSRLRSDLSNQSPHAHTSNEDVDVWATLSRRANRGAISAPIRRCNSACALISTMPSHFAQQTIPSVHRLDGKIFD